jgi:hypothetical protein
MRKAKGGGAVPSVMRTAILTFSWISVDEKERNGTGPMALTLVTCLSSSRLPTSPNRGSTLKGWRKMTGKTVLSSWWR